jgi:hypothetical protein
VPAVGAYLDTGLASAPTYRPGRCQGARCGDLGELAHEVEMVGHLLHVRCTVVREAVDREADRRGAVPTVVA